MTEYKMNEHTAKSAACEAAQYISYIYLLIEHIADQNQYLGVCLWDAKAELRKLSKKNLSLPLTVQAILQILATIKSSNKEDVAWIKIITEVERDILNFNPCTSQSIRLKQKEKRRRINYLIHCLEGISKRNCSIEKKRAMLKTLLGDPALQPLLPISGSNNFYLNLMNYRITCGLETPLSLEFKPKKKSSSVATHTSFFPAEIATSQPDKKPQQEVATICKLD